MKKAVYENKTDPFTLDLACWLDPLPHLHKEIELVYVVSGSTLAYADRNCTALKEGDLFISFPNQVHYYENASRGEYYLLILSPDLLFGLKNLFYENTPKQNVIHLSKKENISRLFLETLNRKNDSYSDTAIVGLINQAFAELLPKFNLKPRIRTDNTTLQNIINYCNENYEFDITLDDLADALHMSKYHISHLFNSKLGLSFSTYINTLRINRACELLEETDKKTTDISNEIGFGSIRSFNRAFLQHMDMTPVQYRKLTKQKQ